MKIKELRFLANVNVEKSVKGQDSLEKITLLEKLLDKYPTKIKNHFVVVTKEKFRFMPLEVI